jgi:hypothetical protein
MDLRDHSAALEDAAAVMTSLRALDGHSASQARDQAPSQRGPRRVVIQQRGLGVFDVIDSLFLTGYLHSVWCGLLLNMIHHQYFHWSSLLLQLQSELIL